MKPLALLALLVACMAPHASLGSDLLEAPAPPICILGVDLTSSGGASDTLRVLFLPRPLPERIDSIVAWTETGVRPDGDVHVRARAYYLLPTYTPGTCRPAGQRTVPRP